MSVQKNRDSKYRHRSKTVAFRVSEGEWKHFKRLVALCGHTQQEFFIKRILQRDIVVNGSPRVAKALKEELGAVLAELKCIESGAEIDIELMDIIRFMATIMDGFNNNEPIKRHTFKY